MLRMPSWTWLKRPSLLAPRRGRLTSGRLLLEALEDRIVPTGPGATITSVSTTMTPNSFVTGNQTATVTVNFSQTVNVTGTPTVTMNDSANTAAHYVSGSGTTALVFNFTVQPNDTAARLDYTGNSALALNGGTIADVSDAVAANLFMPDPTGTNDGLYAAHVTLDATAPGVQGIEPGPFPGGIYGAGASIPLQLFFNTNVTVSGTPLLALNSGGIAQYASGSGTQVLTFLYVVQPGETTHGAALDIAGTGALSLGGGSIKDSLGLASSLTLPAPGSGSDSLTDVGYIIDAPALPSSNPSPTPAPISANLIQQVERQFFAYLQALLYGNLPIGPEVLQNELSTLAVQVQLFQQVDQYLADELSAIAHWAQNTHLFLAELTR